MSGADRRQVLGLVFAWPVAVVAGLVVGRLTGTHWPAPVLAVLWLGVLGWTLHRIQHER